MNKEAALKITRARTSLTLTQPFFSTLLLRLGMVESEKVPAMATDGRVILYNPEWVMKHSDSQVRGVLCHECLHPALGHPFRRGARNLDKWQKACDYPINHILKRANIDLPPNGLFDEKLGQMSADEVYTLLPESPDSDGNGDGKDGGGDDGKSDWNFGGVMDGKGEDGKQPSEAERTQQQEEWKIALAQATETAKACGKLPAGMERVVEDILEPKLDWRALLRMFIEQTINSNYSWTPPNRRYVHQGLYLPSMIKDETVNVSIGVDTSGSITQDELNEFATEITGILSEFKAKCDVIYCDSAIQHTQHFDYEDFPITMEARGGGGTDMPLLVRHIESLDDRPKCMLIFTDMCTAFPDYESDIPVLWITHNQETKAPHGETIVF